MGNMNSSSESDDESATDAKDDTSDMCDEFEPTESDVPYAFELSDLFNYDSLQMLAARIAKDTPESVFQRYREHLMLWLEERQQRSESITLSQFCEFLSVRGVSRSECIQMFQTFDVDDEGVADVKLMLDILKRSLDSVSSHKHLDSVVRTLQSCSCTPGLIDVYDEDKECVGEHAAQLFKFLIKNRASTSTLVYSPISRYNAVTQMRQSALESHFLKLKRPAQKMDEVDAGGGDVCAVTKCIDAYEVSSSKDGAHRMFDGGDSFWQSDGSARTHWIRLKIKSNVVIKQLYIGVASSDQSYMPQSVVVSVGRSVGDLREVKDVRISAHVTGDVLIFENAKIYYPIVQINIRRCHNDGCDVRIRGIRVVGYRIVHEQSLSLFDSLATWYIQILASTATACLPMSEELRKNIMRHSGTALAHMPPLSLSLASADRPSCLSAHVLHEIDVFLQNIATVDLSGRMSSAGLQILLAFHLAQGHVVGILRTLVSLKDNKVETLEESSLLSGIDIVRDSFWKKQGSQLHLEFVETDGGQSDDASGPLNVLASSISTQSYITAEGKLKVDMIFRGSVQVQLTKLRIKVDKGAKGPKCGLVFVYDHDGDFCLETHLKRFSQFDNWRKMEFDKFHRDRRNHRDGGKADHPIAFFSVEDDWDEVEVSLMEWTVGKYVLVKFLEPRLSSAERLGIVSVKFYGFERRLGLTDDIIQAGSLTSDHRSTGVLTTDAAVLKIISFLICIIRDQNKPVKKVIGQLKPSLLNFSDITIAVLWNVYKTFQECPVSCRLILQLAHVLFPHLVSGSSTATSQDEATQLFYKHVCLLVDTGSVSGETDRRLVQIAEEIITDGARVFFPDRQSRSKQLFSLMKDIDATCASASVACTFQSLCQFFSTDPSGLIDLPASSQTTQSCEELSTQSFDPTPVLSVMNTLVSVAHLDCASIIGAMKRIDKSDHLVRLLCSLQTNLLVWCGRQLEPTDEMKELCEDEATQKDMRAAAIHLLQDYISLVTTKTTSVLKLFSQQSEADMKCLMDLLSASFISATLPQLVLILSQLCDVLTSCIRMKILSNFKPIVDQLCLIATKMQSLFHKLGSSFWTTVSDGDEKVLRVWEMESKHNYENSQHTIQSFICPGASLFVVEFDPRCETERRYDYLEFTDSIGTKSRFEHKVNTEKWPLIVIFRGGPRLQFLFHSDCSNNEWGYKFKVTAKGSSDVPMCWMFDLHLSLAKLIGQLCGSTLDITKVQRSNATDGRYHAEAELLRSELWMTVFRGGYLTGPTTLQQSVSYKSETESCLNLLTFLKGLSDKSNIECDAFLTKCQSQYVGNRNRSVGGPEVDEVVVNAFAALIWHTENLRDDVNKYVKGDCNGLKYLEISPGIQEAYNTAESLRYHLVEQRQRWIVNQELPAEPSKDVGEKASILNDTVQNWKLLIFEPVRQTNQKALFLLRFAGITKAQLKTETKMKYGRRGSKSYNRLQSASSIDGSHHIDSAFGRYPSFQLVLEFIKDPAWSSSSVEALLEEHSMQALAVSEICRLLDNFIEIYSYGEDIFQIENVLVIQELLQYQQKFACHYADGLDGCGLQLEASVRQSYYTLLRRLVLAIQSTPRIKLTQPTIECYDYMEACTLHLLDISWQVYDLPFVEELNLPKFFHSLAVASVPVHKRIELPPDDETEREEHKQCVKWLEEVQSLGINAWRESRHKEPKKMTKMFIARYSDQFDISIVCDGCQATLLGRRYHCLQCTDVDLCPSCYVGGIMPTGADHSVDHDVTHFVYKCDGCHGFIVGSRMHCNVCEDFDLCLSCQITSQYPARHKPEHSYTKHPMVVFRLVNETYSLLQSYCHQHVWLLFSSLALSISSLLYARHNDQWDTEYMQAAVRLYRQCIDLLTKFFMQPIPLGSLEEEERKGDVSITALQEVAFLMHGQPRIMGLLGAMIPEYNKTAFANDISQTFISTEFISMLFSLARGDAVHDSNTQHYAIGLLSQLLQRVSSNHKIVDSSYHLGSESDDDSDGADHGHAEGYVMTRFLFSFGAAYLQRSGLEYANSMATILQKLSSVPAWKDAFYSYLSDSIARLKRGSPSLLSIFVLCVVAGFPEVLTLGSRVKYIDSGTEQKQGFVVKHFPDKNQAMVVDRKTRKQKLVKDKCLDVIRYEACSVNERHVISFIDIVQRLVKKQDDVECLWMLSLVLKALLKFIESAGSPVGDRQSEEWLSTRQLFEPEFVQSIISLASTGTGFSKQWLVADMEILSLMLYTREEREPLKTKRRERMFSKSADSATGLSATYMGGGVNPLEGLDEITLQTFHTLHDHLHISFPVLRAVYELNGKSSDAVLVAVHSSLQNETFIVTEEVKQLAENWETVSSMPNPSSDTDLALDVGTKLSCSALIEPNKTTDSCVADETGNEAQQLMLSTGAGAADCDMRNASRQRRNTSAALLKKELDNEAANTDGFLIKVNLAMSILYARHVLTALLANWPTTGHTITAELIGCTVEANVPYVLDLLNRPEAKETFQKVVRNVIRYCRPEGLEPIAIISCTFMEEVDLITVTKESPHFVAYKEMESIEEKIHIPGAAYLSVHFDCRCTTEESGDELLMALTSDFSQEKHVFSGSSDQWINFDMPGDTLYYRFVSDYSSPDWGFKFTVIGGRLGRFDTGYVILNELLNSAELVRLLPLNELWKRLIYVACSQTGQQRLKSYQLLLALLNATLKCGRTYVAAGKTSLQQTLDLDLGLLRPLWRLYRRLSEENPADSCVMLPPTPRALTELFYAAETLVSELGLTKDYILSLLDNEDIHLMLYKGFENVAMLSVAIGHDNAATRLLHRRRRAIGNLAGSSSLAKRRHMPALTARRSRTNSQRTRLRQSRSGGYLRASELV